MCVSVIIPVLNCQQFIGEAIESVLRQGPDISQIIVVDDGSTDESAKIAATFPLVQVFFQEQAGIGPARNRGTQQASGDFLAFLDADDLWFDDKTARQRAAFRDSPALDAVFGQVEQFDEHGIREADDVHFTIAGSMLIRREAFARVGEFSAEHRAPSRRIHRMVWPRYRRSVERRATAVRCTETPDSRRQHDHP
jgi:glycosyltransferase involved in cell wall biosynthesis